MEQKMAATIVLKMQMQDPFCSRHTFFCFRILAKSGAYLTRCFRWVPGRLQGSYAVEPRCCTQCLHALNLSYPKENFVGALAQALQMPVAGARPISHTSSYAHDGCVDYDSWLMRYEPYWVRVYP